MARDLAVEVVCRENVLASYRRVVRNKGRVIVLLYRYLRNGMMAGGVASPCSRGTP